MKFHPIFTKKFRLWWGIIALTCILVFIIFGLPIFSGIENNNYIFSTIGTLFSSLIFGSIIYLFYWLFTNKWNNNSYMLFISIACIFCLTTYSYQTSSTLSSLNKKTENSKTSMAEDFDTISNLYSNFKYDIAFDAPDNWSIDNGLSEYTIFRTFQEDSLITFSIIAQKYSKGNVVKLFRKNEEKMIDSIRTMFKTESNIEIEEIVISEGVLRNYPAVKSIYHFTLRGVDAEVDFTSITYQMNRDNSLFTFTLTLPRIIFEDYPSYEQLFNKVHFLVD